MRLFGIVGAGGFGREVMPIARDAVRARGEAGEPQELVFVVEDQYSPSVEKINGHRVLTLSTFLSAPASQRWFNIAIGDSRVRERIASSIPREAATPFEIVAPTHVSLDNNVVGEGAILCSFSHITSNARIGRYFHANIYSYVAHDCIIGDFVTLAPCVKCNGHVVIEDHAYIGTGAVIRDGTTAPIVIGKGAVVGMGAVVTKSVPSGAVVVGNPARLREPQSSGGQ